LPLATNLAVLNMHASEAKYYVAEFSRIFTAADRLIKIRRRFRGRIFSAASQNSADPDIRRRLGILLPRRVTGAGTQQRGVAARLSYCGHCENDTLPTAKASDRQRINSQLNRAKRNGYCPPDLPTFEELSASADEQLFSKTVRLSNHVMHALLAPPSVASQH